MRRRLLVILSLSILWWPTGAAGQSQTFELAARHKHLMGGADGTLVIGDDGIEFRGSPQYSYRWRYLDLREIRIVSPTRLIVRTYVEPTYRRRVRMGPGPSYTFETRLLLPAGAVQYLLNHFSRPIVTVVMPPLPAEARGRIAVKQRRDEGELAFYDEGLAYVTAYGQESRFWRFHDVASVLRLDPYRLQITAYEGEPGNTHTFTFELKTELPQAMYDAIWQRVNAPDRTTGRPHD